MREQKKHWRQCHVIDGERNYPPVAVCGTWYPKQYANAKRKVTCKRCLRAIGGAA